MDYKSTEVRHSLKLTPQVVCTRAALKGFEGRISSVLLPAITLMAAALAIVLWA
jgi:hypothetical protein